MQHHRLTGNQSVHYRELDPATMGEKRKRQGMQADTELKRIRRSERTLKVRYAFGGENHDRGP